MLAVLLATAGCEMMVQDDADDAELTEIASGGFDVKVIDMNIAGGMIHAGSTAALTPVLEQINAWGPDIVMLQEVCTGQRDYFKAVLEPAGWTVAFAAMRPHPKCGANQEIGVLLASPHPMTGIDARFLGHADEDRDQVFKLLCANIRATKRVYACTTHLRAFTTPEDNEARRAQARRIHNLLEPIINQGKAVIVGGDFNAKPQHEPMDWLYRLTTTNKFAGEGEFHEADQTGNCNSQSGGCRDGAATHRKVGETSGGGKLDYVFFSRNRFSGKKNISGNPIWTGTSDHALYRARALVTGTDDSGDARLDPSEDGVPVDSADRAVFDAGFYLSVHQDVQAAFGWNAEAAREHWLTYGIREGRVGSPTFDVNYYRATYPDLAELDNEYLVYHFLAHGIPEGRKGSPILDAPFYLSQYADLRAAFGDANYYAAVAHFLNFGLGEGRLGSTTFDARWYLQTNPDVAQVFGADNYWGAAIHWYGWGRFEGRPPAP